MYSNRHSLFQSLRREVQHVAACMADWPASSEETRLRCRLILAVLAEDYHGRMLDYDGDWVCDQYADEFLDLQQRWNANSLSDKSFFSVEAEFEAATALAYAYWAVIAEFHTIEVESYVSTIFATNVQGMLRKDAEEEAWLKSREDQKWKRIPLLTIGSGLAIVIGLGDIFSLHGYVGLSSGLFVLAGLIGLIAAGAEVFDSRNLWDREKALHNKWRGKSPDWFACTLSSE